MEVKKITNTHKIIIYNILKSAPGLTISNSPHRTNRIVEVSHVIGIDWLLIFILLISQHPWRASYDISLFDQPYNKQTYTQPHTYNLTIRVHKYITLLDIIRFLCIAYHNNSHTTHNIYVSSLVFAEWHAEARKPKENTNLISRTRSRHNHPIRRDIMYQYMGLKGVSVGLQLHLMCQTCSTQIHTTID